MLDKKMMKAFQESIDACSIAIDIARFEVKYGIPFPWDIIRKDLPDLKESVRVLEAERGAD